MLKKNVFLITQDLQAPLYDGSGVVAFRLVFFTWCFVSGVYYYARISNTMGVTALSFSGSFVFVVVIEVKMIYSTVGVARARAKCNPKPIYSRVSSLHSAIQEA